MEGIAPTRYNDQKFTAESILTETGRAQPQPPGNAGSGPHGKKADTKTLWKVVRSKQLPVLLMILFPKYNEI